MEALAVDFVGFPVFPSAAIVVYTVHSHYLAVDTVAFAVSCFAVDYFASALVAALHYSTTRNCVYYVVAVVAVVAVAAVVAVVVVVSVRLVLCIVFFVVAVLPVLPVAVVFAAILYALVSLFIRVSSFLSREGREWRGCTG